MFLVAKARTKPASSVPVDIDADHAATRQRLLDAAGAVFAEVGFEKAHVRDICARARANVAAVKYHFGGKYPLYESAIHWCFDREQQLAAERTGLPVSDDAEKLFSHSSRVSSLDCSTRPSPPGTRN